MPSPRMGGLALGDRGGSAGGSGSPRLLGSGAPASVDKSPSSSSAALGLRLGGGGGGSSGGSSSEHQQRHIGSVPDDWPMYSSQPDDYIIGPSIGFGASSTVYQASFRPLNGRACAVKVIDLEAFGRDTDELRRETQLMSLSKHPNVLRVRGCWVEGSKLHIATRLMSSGSMLDIMRFGWSDGFDEIVIATVLRQALEGLNYLHINGWLHRDLKAANMLVDDDGTVLLGDFGVGVYLGEEPKSRATKGAKAEEKENIDEGWAEGKRKSFVGTPCWMAPEVVERKGYGTKADIWSFGITALELTQGRAPYSRLPPVKVLMKTLQEDPPTLDRTGGAHKYSKVFDDFVRLCLQKDPTKRPSAEKLLQHGFFRQAKNKKHLVSTVLAGLPPLAERQERRRAMSIASLRKQASWDFGSVSSRGGGSGFISTPLHERFDPFSNFSGAIASSPASAAVSPTTSAFASPQGSLGRSSSAAAGLPHHHPHPLTSAMKLVSIDGHHAFVEEEEADIDKLAEDWRNNSGSSHVVSSPNRARANSAGKRTSRGASAHRKSVSFDGDAVQEEEEQPENGLETHSQVPPPPSAPLGSALAPIDEGADSAKMQRQGSSEEGKQGRDTENGVPANGNSKASSNGSTQSENSSTQNKGKAVNTTAAAESKSSPKGPSSGLALGQAASTAGGGGSTSVLGKIFRSSSKEKEK